MSHTDLWPLTKPIFYYYWQIRNGAFVAVFRHDWYWRRLWTRHGTLGWTTRLLLLLWSGCQWLNIFFGTRVRRPFSDIRTFRSSWITYLYFAFFGHFRFFVFDPNRNFIPSIDSYYDNITNKNHLHYRLCPTSHNNKNAFFCDFYCIFCISRIFQRRLYRFFFLDIGIRTLITLLIWTSYFVTSNAHVRKRATNKLPTKIANNNFLPSRRYCENTAPPPAGVCHASRRRRVASRPPHYRYCYCRFYFFNYRNGPLDRATTISHLAATSCITHLCTNDNNTVVQQIQYEL